MIRCRHGFPVTLGNGESVPCYICSEPGRSRMLRRSACYASREEVEKRKIERGQAKGGLEA